MKVCACLFIKSRSPVRVDFCRLCQRCFAVLKGDCGSCWGKLGWGLSNRLKNVGEFKEFNRKTFI